MTILELREKRAKAGKPQGVPGFPQNDKGVLSAEDDAAYTRMEQEITDLGKEIASPGTPGGAGGGTEPPGEQAPDGQAHERVRRTLRPAAPPMEYRQNFWNMMRLQSTDAPRF